MEKKAGQQEQFKMIMIYLNIYKKNMQKGGIFRREENGQHSQTISKKEQKMD